MADVFISYKREDRAWAERVDATLREAGLTTWWDPSLVAGEQFNQAIERELSSAKCVVVIWSEAAHQSSWVHAEAIRAFGKGNLVSARIDDVVLKYPFDLVQTADLRRNGAAEIVDGVRAKLSLSTSGSNARDGRSLLQRINDARGARWWLLGLLSLLAVINAYVFWLDDYVGPVFLWLGAFWPMSLQFVAMDFGRGRRSKFFASALGAFLSYGIGLFLSLSLTTFFAVRVDARFVQYLVMGPIFAVCVSYALGRATRWVKWA